jgi:hypothetical protein
MLTIFYHRDFDGIASAAILADVLREKFAAHDVRWEGVNHDRKKDWPAWNETHKDFAVVDFFFHPAAQFWFDHHPTTFLTEEYRSLYKPSDRWQFDPKAPSCPPIILQHAEERFGYKVPDRFHELALWSNVIDAAKFNSAEQALFGDAPALRVMRALMVAPRPDWSDEIVARFLEGDLDSTAADPDIEKRYQRACRNRDTALQQFRGTVLENHGGVLLYDASSDRIRRERFAPYYFYPDIDYAVGLLPTRGGLHITAAQNPWNKNSFDIDVGALCELYGGGGHKAVGGANPSSQSEGRRIAKEIAESLRRRLAEARSTAP